jgi:hypothetical protein
MTMTPEWLERAKEMEEMQKASDEDAAHVAFVSRIAMFFGSIAGLFVGAFSTLP